MEDPKKFVSDLSTLFQELETNRKTLQKEQETLNIFASELDERESNIIKREEISQSVLDDLNIQIEQIKLLINNCSKDSDLISVNAGGTVFQTYRYTLLKYPDTLLYYLFSGHADKKIMDDDGTYFIDINPKYFECLLDTLRSDGVFSIRHDSHYNKFLRDLGLLSFPAEGSPDTISQLPANTILGFSENSIQNVGNVSYMEGIVQWTINISNPINVFIGILSNNVVSGWRYTKDNIIIHQSSSFQQFIENTKWYSNEKIKLELDMDNNFLTITNGTYNTSQYISPSVKDARLVLIKPPHTKIKLESFIYYKPGYIRRCDYIHYDVDEFIRNEEDDF